ncbi:uncharacterized protein LOC133868733 [Alnus glutinosa]|uniref:uncharacterized protein LOC133868733 n=1 Tax=Alnus glutinosa TaxID=3517 RepID=UPI002D78F167|nr:uncharacterized protein LOC133868733 [Alnus glutinosa]
MDGIGRMKFVWMMMMMGILSIVVQAGQNPPAVSPTSSLPFSPLPDDHPQQADFKLPKFPKIPHIPLPPKLLIVGMCIAECQKICQAGRPAFTYRVCMVTYLPIKCRPSRLDVVYDCALGCMAAATTTASGNDKVEGYIETCYKNCGKDY